MNKKIIALMLFPVFLAAGFASLTACEKSVSPEYDDSVKDSGESEINAADSGEEEEYGIAEEPGIYWEDEMITVYKTSSGGAWYPRMLALTDGTLFCAFDTNENYSNSVIKIMKSDDGGLTWEGLSVIDYYPGLNCANPL